MSQLGIITATIYQPDWDHCTRSHLETAKGHHNRYVIGGMAVMEAYQAGFILAKEPIQGYIHDDLLINEFGWDERVMAEFHDPSVGLVGFGGGKGYGSPDLYRVPYHLPNLGRNRFMSNMRNAEHHGARFGGECDIACLDGFAMFVRRKVLKDAGGWPVGTPVNYFCYDMWLSAEVRRQGYRARLVGVACDHLGFRSSSMKPLIDSHADAHKWLYEQFRGTLPFDAEDR